MVMSGFIPEKGDLVWLEFNPQAGHEQQGHRPAICVSQKLYNKKQDWRCFARLQVT